MRASSGGVWAAAALALLVATSAGMAQSGDPTATLPSAPSAGKKSTTAERRKKAGNLAGHGGPVKALRVDPRSGRALTGSFDYAMMVWEGAGEAPRPLLRLQDHGGAVNAVAFVPGAARALAAGDDGQVALWDIATGRLVHRFEGHEGKIAAIAVSPDGRWAASAGWDRTARLWDLASLTAGPVLDQHKGPVHAVAFLGDGAHVATAGADGSIALFATSDGTFVRTIHRHVWGINVLERLPGDGDRLLFGALNGSAAVVDAFSGEVVAELKPSERPILALASIDKPGLLATGDGGGTIRVYRAADARLIEEYQNPYGPVWALAFLPGGTHMYYGGLDDFATLWQVSPRAAFEPIEGDFPRRFQVLARASGGDTDLVAEGEVQFARKCSVCHTLERDGANRAGPTLHNIFGRRIGTLAGYPYSPALTRLDIVWNEETVSKLFELGPEVLTPGSKMPLQKMTDARQRAALINYLRVATQDRAAVDGGGEGAQNSTSKGEKP